MATSLAMKRMLRERKVLETPNDDFIVFFKDDDLFNFDAYVVGPSETLYSYKVVKLHFQIPPQYPLEPPICTFIQHSGGRIHPNLYKEGKVCLSILGTWNGEKWATAMTCQTVLITIRSLLDNKPYTHEPNQGDNPAYNSFVQYGTWRWLLLDYLRHESEPVFKTFLQTYVAKHGDEMMSEFHRQATVNANSREFRTPYGNQQLVVNYPKLERDLAACVQQCRSAVEAATKEKSEGVGDGAG